MDPHQQRAAEFFESLARKIRAGEMRAGEYVMEAGMRDVTTGDVMEYEATGSFMLRVELHKRPK